ncbi:MAG: PAS domain S-box protein [Candidatus Dormibacteraeota bacterium]|nr:PAS domain S-box protein [Candidatus Dormibacteraeota bacterium]
MGQVRIEFSLSEAEQHLKTVFESAPIGICTVSMEGRILTANPALERMLGIQGARGRRPALRDLVHPADVSAIQAMFRRVVEGEERVAAERRFRRADGSFFWGRFTASAVTDAKGGPRFCVAVLEDVDERRRVDTAMEEINARIEALSRAKSGLVAGVSHEFRTALTSIQGFSELLRDQELGSEEVHELGADINSEAQRLGRLIDDLLDLDRMETGGLPLRRQTVDLNGLLVSLAERTRRSREGRQVALRLADNLPPIQADSDRLTQVFSNLLSNAVKYAPPDSPIEVTTARIPRGVRTTVRDHGPGIPEDSLESIFDRYTRLQSQVRSDVVGSGLGLPIVRQIVSMHGGRAWAENSAEGGAILNVELPLVGASKGADAGPGL